MNESSYNRNMSKFNPSTKNVNSNTLNTNRGVLVEVNPNSRAERLRALRGIGGGGGAKSTSPTESSNSSSSSNDVRQKGNIIPIYHHTLNSSRSHLPSSATRNIDNHLNNIPLSSPSPINNNTTTTTNRSKAVDKNSVVKVAVPQRTNNSKGETNNAYNLNKPPKQQQVMKRKLQPTARREESSRNLDVKLDKEEEEFSTFLQNLKYEVAVDHMKLWSSYHTLFSNTNQSPTNTKSKSQDPLILHTQPTNHKAAQPFQKNKTKYKLDSQTQEKFASIHTNLIERYCYHSHKQKKLYDQSSQLLNDRSYRKEMKLQHHHHHHDANKKMESSHYLSQQPQDVSFVASTTATSGAMNITSSTIGATAAATPFPKFIALNATNKTVAPAAATNKGHHPNNGIMTKNNANHQEKQPQQLNHAAKSNNVTTNDLKSTGPARSHHQQPQEMEQPQYISPKPKQQLLNKGKNNVVSNKQGQTSNSTSLPFITESNHNHRNYNNNSINNNNNNVSSNSPLTTVFGERVILKTPPRTNTSTSSHNIASLLSHEDEISPNHLSFSNSNPNPNHNLNHNHIVQPSISQSNLPYNPQKVTIYPNHSIDNTTNDNQPSQSSNHKSLKLFRTKKSTRHFISSGKEQSTQQPPIWQQSKMKLRKVYRKSMNHMMNSGKQNHQQKLDIDLNGNDTNFSSGGHIGSAHTQQVQPLSYVPSNHHQQQQHTISMTNNNFITSTSTIKQSFLLKNTWTLNDNNAAQTTPTITNNNYHLRLQEDTILVYKNIQKEILWSINRNTIQSLTLTNDATTADIMHNDSHDNHDINQNKELQQRLVFQNTLDCLQFAQAFYCSATAITGSNSNDNLPSASGTNQPQQIDNSLLQQQSCQKEDFTKNTNKNDFLSQHLMKQIQQTTKPDDEKQTIAASDNANIPKFTKEEEETISKYKKMLNVGIPKEAVQHKMTSDGITNETITNAVLSIPNPQDDLHDKTKAIVPLINLTKEEEELVSKYKKMLKVSIPKEAVRHKMISDQVEEKIRNIVLDELPLPLPSPPSSNLTAKEEEIASKYKKMLKISIPKDAVRHKMQSDQIDIKIMNFVLGIESTTQPLPTSSNIEQPQQTQMSAEEQEIIKKYRKMLKLNIPKDVIQHNMKMEGITKPHILEAVLGKDYASAGTKNKEVKPMRSKQTKNNLVSLHWTPLTASAIEQSIWMKKIIHTNNTNIINMDSTSSTKTPTHTNHHNHNDLNSSFTSTVTTDTKNSTIDISKLEELFQKKKNQKNNLNKTTASNDDNTQKLAKILNFTRANNVEIGLKAFKEFTHDELVTILEEFDPQQDIPSDKIAFLKDLLPNENERKALELYNTNKKTQQSELVLVPAEIFFLKMLQVPRIHIKVQILQTLNSYQDITTNLSNNFQLLTTACYRVMDSDKLIFLLSTILHVGNIMNEGTHVGDALGFKFDSLLKLTQTKSVDGKLTVLDYIVMTFCEKNENESTEGVLLDDFVSGKEIPGCALVCRMPIGDLMLEVKNMNNNIRQCEKELELIREEQRSPFGKKIFNVFSKKINHVATTGMDPQNNRNSILSSIRSKHNSSESDGNDSNNQDVSRKKMLNSIIQTRIESTGEEKTTSSKQEWRKKLTPVKMPKQSQYLLLNDDDTTNASNDDDDHDSSNNNGFDSYSPGCQRLHKFVTHSNSVHSRLVKERDGAVEACKQLSIYFGESQGDPQNAINILSVLNEFIQSLSVAMKKYDDRKKKEEEASIKQNKQNPNKKETSTKKNSSFKHQIGKNGDSGSKIKRQLATKMNLSPIIEQKNSSLSLNESISYNNCIEVIDENNNAVELKKTTPIKTKSIVNNEETFRPRISDRLSSFYNPMDNSTSPSSYSSSSSCDEGQLLPNGSSKMKRSTSSSIMKKLNNTNKRRDRFLNTLQSIIKDKKRKGDGVDGDDKYY